MSRSANDDDDALLEARLQNLPRIAQVVHDDNSKSKEDPAVRSYKPSRESIAMMHGELDGSITNEAQNISSYPDNPTSETKTAPADSSCCLIL
jgi:hypothetical protein